MFSVGASPFNSRRRQLYGGWTMAEAGQNIWGAKAAAEMEAKYGTGTERANARAFLRAYKKLVKDNPELKARVRLQGKPYWEDAIRPELSAAQKADILSRWHAVPFDAKNRLAHVRASLLRHAPYPNYQIMNAYPSLGVPYMETSPSIMGISLDDIMEPYRTRAEMWAAARKSRGINPYTDTLAAAVASLPVIVKKEAANDPDAMV